MRGVRSARQTRPLMPHSVIVRRIGVAPPTAKQVRNTMTLANHLTVIGLLTVAVLAAATVALTRQQ